MRRRGRNVDDLPLLPDGSGWLLVEFGGDSMDEARRQADALNEALQRSEGPTPHVCRYEGEQADTLWEIRKSALGRHRARAGHGRHLARLGGRCRAAGESRCDYLRDFRRLLDEFGYECSLYGHFGDGCIHVRIDFDFSDDAGRRKYRAFVTRAADLVVSYGGSLSGEHGDGQSRGELLPKMYGQDLVNGLPRVQAAVGPGLENEPRQGGRPLPARYQPAPGTRLRAVAPEDLFRLSARTMATLPTWRCAASASARAGATTRAVMCPSYMATREEMHSTRGRARLLFEMSRGDLITDGWRSEGVLEALDLCLACKGCKGQCPVNVDMATYKAEFLAHHYARRLRPREAYAFGFIHRWARLARHMPGVVNAATRLPVTAPLVKWLANIHPERQLPKFAKQDFRRQYRRRDVTPHSDGKQVILWPDTFNAYLQPQTLMAGAQVLEDAGYRLLLPRRRLCCGRPLYDYGFLHTARALLEKVMQTLDPLLRQGVPVVGMEPTCIATFRDELPNLFPDDERAQRLSSQSFLFTEFLQREGFQPPKVGRKALVHAHCNHVAVFGTAHERKLLDATGLDYDFLDSGCCGMAGAFGYEKPHYDVSLKCGERVLLPAVRAAGEDTLIISDGYSCREQIIQETGRTALHLAQVWNMSKRRNRHD